MSSKRFRRKPYKETEIQLAPMLDVMIVLIFFLLKIFNASGVVVNVPNGIVLPHSESVKNNTTGILVQVAPDKIWVEDQLVLDNAAPPPAAYDMGDRRIVPLYNELVKKREEFQLVEKSSPNAKKFSGQVNLVVDKTMKYNYIQKVMFTCAEAGYVKYKFVVLGEPKG